MQYFFKTTNLVMIQRFFALALIAFMISTSACSNSKIENQLEQLSQEEITEFKRKLIRDIAKLPTEVSQQGKLHPMFDEYYEKEVGKYDLEKYYKNEDGKIYFLFTRIAPSVKLKKVAQGGYVVFGRDGKISDMEEVFRTWKHEPEVLAPMADMLFEKMVKGEDLSPYYPQNSGDEEIIEFPDAETYYDKQQRMWISTRENPLKEFYDEKARKIDSVFKAQDSIALIN
jgi:hypothetical protein